MTFKSLTKAQQRELLRCYHAKDCVCLFSSDKYPTFAALVRFGLIDGYMLTRESITLGIAMVRITTRGKQLIEDSRREKPQARIKQE